jgi:hypothetical protein
MQLLSLDEIRDVAVGINSERRQSMPDSVGLCVRLR